jgi:hypothetical protein
MMAVQAPCVKLLDFIQSERLPACRRLGSLDLNDDGQNHRPAAQAVVD